MSDEIVGPIGCEFSVRRVHTFSSGAVARYSKSWGGTTSLQLGKVYVRIGRHIGMGTAFELCVCKLHVGGDLVARHAANTIMYKNVQLSVESWQCVKLA